MNARRHPIAGYVTALILAVASVVAAAQHHRGASVVQQAALKAAIIQTGLSAEDLCGSDAGLPGGGAFTCDMCRDFGAGVLVPPATDLVQRLCPPTHALRAALAVLCPEDAPRPPARAPPAVLL